MIMLWHLGADFGGGGGFRKAIAIQMSDTGKAFGSTEIERRVIIYFIMPSLYSVDKGQCFLSHIRNVG